MDRARNPRRTRAVVTLTAALTLAAVGVLGPAPAAADPRTAAQAEKLVEQSERKLGRIDEQVHQAEAAVDEQRAAARAAARAAEQAQAALTALEPQLRAVAQSGYTGRQSRVAAFLTSGSADELVQQMTTLDLIASHTDTLVSRVATAQRTAEQARTAADAAEAEAAAGLAALEEQKAQLAAQVEEYQDMFDRLSAAEQARVTRRVAGRAMARPAMAELPVEPGSVVATAIATALSEVGSPYSYGAGGPDAFDCSGLTSFAYRAAGIELPHSSQAQAGVGAPVSRSALQPGDLVFFYQPISHVGLYIGNGMMVHARTYGSPVAVTSVDQSGYAGAVRVVRSQAG